MLTVFIQHHIFVVNNRAFLFSTERLCCQFRKNTTIKKTSLLAVNYKFLLNCSQGSLSRDRPGREHARQRFGRDDVRDDHRRNRHHPQWRPIPRHNNRHIC